MNSIEEKLWNYIDGACTADERQAIEELINSDEVCRRKFEELSALNQQFSAIELDEPPMAFTYNVMEGIRAEAASQPLKAAIDKRIVKGIAAFFIVTISILLIYSLANINWSVGNTPLPALSKVKLPQVSGYLTSPVINGFLFFDLVIGLFLFDGYLRRKKSAKHA